MTRAKTFVKKRAVNDLQKQQKYQSIIDTADDLLSNANFEEITMAKIASKARLAKGTLFIYFQTKEDIFLSLTEQIITQWSNNLGNNLQDLIKNGKNIEIQDLIDILMNSVDNKTLVKLFSILDDTLEQNIDFQRAFKFKTFLKKKMIHLGKLIEEVLPRLEKGDGIVILSQLFTCLIGAFKVSHPSAIVKNVVQKPGMEMFNREFMETLKNIVTCYILGYLEKKNK
jgi:AcrR family transcriptional regulator